MYFIYHIKGIKIGVSTNPENRVKNQGYTEYEILEEHTCIDTVSTRELELQKEYGYRVDTILYKESYKHRLKNVTKETLSKGANTLREKYPNMNKTVGKKVGHYLAKNKIGMFGYSKKERTLISKRGGKTTGDMMKKSGKIQSLGSQWGKINGQKYCKKVYQYDLSGNLIKVFAGKGIAQRELGYCISKNVTGKQKTCHGFIFSYEPISRT